MKYTQSVYLIKHDFMMVFVVKIKFILEQATKAQKGSRCIALLIL